MNMSMDKIIMKFNNVIQHMLTTKQHQLMLIENHLQLRKKLVKQTKKHNLFFKDK